MYGVIISILILCSLIIGFIYYQNKRIREHNLTELQLENQSKGSICMQMSTAAIESFCWKIAFLCKLIVA
jgi:hypothetical protein